MQDLNVGFEGIAPGQQFFQSMPTNICCCKLNYILNGISLFRFDIFHVSECILAELHTSKIEIIQSSKSHNRCYFFLFKNLNSFITNAPFNANVSTLNVAQFDT